MKNQQFHDFEFGFWNVTAAPYDEGIGPVTSQTIRPMLAHLNLKKGDRLLDIACGPGYVTNAAKDLNVTGVDFSEAMIALAKKTYPGSDFQVGNAEDLSFDDNSFDGACCSFGILHFANPDDAAREAHRVCKPGARYAFTVWNTMDKSLAMGFLMEAIQKHGATSTNLPEGKPFFHYALEENSFPLLKNAGFQNLRREEAPLFWPMQSAESFVLSFRDGGARIGAILRGQDKKSLSTIIKHVQEKIAPYKTAAGYNVPISVVITSGQK
jgi:ubiquinone/menaquinone biosynthesis C-methylase UbiE